MKIHFSFNKDDLIKAVESIVKGETGCKAICPNLPDCQQCQMSVIITPADELKFILDNME